MSKKEVKLVLLNDNALLDDFSMRCLKGTLVRRFKVPAADERLSFMEVDLKAAGYFRVSSYRATEDIAESAVKSANNLLKSCDLGEVLCFEYS